MQTNKKWTLITGASMGIGAELAHVFAEHQHHLILVARSEGRLKTLAEELKAKHAIDVKYIVQDLALENAAKHVFNRVKELGCEVDILVNNAGVGLHSYFHASDLEETMKMIRLNISSLTELTHYFLNPMLEAKHGKILNVASTAAFQPGPLMAVYYATKAYVLNFSEALYEESRKHGVVVTTLCPGPTRSEFQKNAGMGKVALFSYACMDSRPVAEKAYRALMKKKALVIPGLLNKVFAFSTRLSPRFMTPKFTMWLQTERKR